MSSKGTALVIGGGIIGLSSAYYLLKDGWQIILMDKGDFDDNASQGNAGMLVPSHFIPLAAPGMVSKGIRWMFDSRSPFYVKPALDWSLFTWGMRFLRSATAAKVERASAPLRDYHLLSQRLYRDLQAEPDFDFSLQNKGILMLYKTDHAAQEELQVGAKARALGLDIDILNGKEVQVLEPHLKLDVLGAVHYRCDAHLNPAVLTSQLRAYLERKGAMLLSHAEVAGVRIDRGRVTQVSTADSNYDTDLLVMTGGAWLPALARMAGLNIPVMPGKGYSITEPVVGPALVHPALLVEAKVAVTPLGGWIRYGGTMELGAMDHRINMRRVEGIVQAVPHYYPELNPEVPAPEKIWYGYRPCSPDGLPYLGRAKGINNLIVAGGHGMMGISLGPATGKLVAELAAGRSTCISLDIYNPGRFQ
ncbi:NAD(P)/FAD-dependent oxidoreductase [Dyadobacter tibetensis]|uniref:NAD(P)/FAD-dependent oxidoreductase n=1 Tax=Dyadobacter tibetensis TaxID=1211851 RepID=UPI000470D4BD|nr:FAD-dependent oxidoreductase [Dyadobacter tibetensis]